MNTTIKNLKARKQPNFFERFQVTSLLMQSANGTLYNGVEVNLEIGEKVRDVVVKFFPKSCVRTYAGVRGVRCPSEIYFHLKAYTLARPFIVEPLDWIERTDDFAIAMEKPQGTMDLFDFCNKYGVQSEKNARIIWTQIVIACYNMHLGGVMHSDIKDENVLINPTTLQIKIIDFGCAKKVQDRYEKPSGTAAYWPPELKSHGNFKPGPVTVWSLGSILYLLLAGEWKYSEESGFMRNFLKEQRLTDEAQQLINRILCIHEYSRITLQEVIQSAWVQHAPKSPKKRNSSV
ncbi:unnamed protein product [Oikopleura dioica]|uniref:Serine/threonine-protein kinase 1 n=1 Tax=Oikopleura dioica TaxID=34765 RepID=E4YXN3_OIKDI|nr:unnamed protein product [Oikopleura dioica]